MKRTIVSINMDDDILAEVDKNKGDYLTRTGYVNMILWEALMK